MRGSGSHGETGRAGRMVQPWEFHSRSKGWWEQGVPSRPLCLTSLQAVGAQGHPKLRAERVGTTLKEILSTHEHVLSCSDVLGLSVDDDGENWQDLWPPRMN